MRAYRAFSSRNLRVVVLATFFVVPLVGCDDTITSPCYECEPIEWGYEYTRVVQREFSVGDGATILVDDFAGNVTYRVGPAGAVRVVASLRSARNRDLDRIVLSMVSHQSGVDIRAENPDRARNVSVDLEITAPASASPLIGLGAGNIDYRGRPRGSYRFSTGVGSIRLKLPSDVDVVVELSVAVGSIFLGFPLNGAVSNPPGYVRGRIGDGGDGDIEAGVAVGSISVEEM